MILLLLIIVIIRSLNPHYLIEYTYQLEVLCDVSSVCYKVYQVIK